MDDCIRFRHQSSSMTAMQFMRETREFSRELMKAEQARRRVPLKERLAVLRNQRSLYTLAHRKFSEKSLTLNSQGSRRSLTLSEGGRAPPRPSGALSRKTSALSRKATGNVVIDENKEFHFEQQDEEQGHAIHLLPDQAEEEFYEGACRPSMQLPDEHAVARAVEAFFRTINDETIVAEPPPGVMPPVCECYEKCALRQIAGEIDTGVWVCAWESCMFNQLLADRENSEHILEVLQPTVDSKEITMDIDACLAESPQEFWARLSLQMITPDTAATRLLTAFLTVPNCECGGPCRIVMCCASGDFFWACASQTCYSIFFAQHRYDGGAQGDGNIWKWIELGSCDIDRYTHPGYVLRWFGYSFTLDIWRKLARTEADSDFPQGSFKLPRGSKYDMFISYRGSTGRLPLWLALVSEFNLLPAFLFLTVFCPLVCIGVSFVDEPCENGVPHWLLAADSCNDQVLWKSWFIFTSWSALVLIIILLFWQPVMYWYLRNYRIFLDKLTKNNF